MRPLLLFSLGALLLGCGAKEPQPKPQPKASDTTTAPAPLVASSPTSLIARPQAQTLAISSILMRDETHGYATGERTLYTTDDGGSRWKAVSLPTIPPDTGLSAVFFLDASRAWLIADGLQNVIWRTTDGGKTWERSALDIKQLEDDGGVSASLHFIDANNGWAYFNSSPGMSQHNGAIFSTKDGGDTWQRISDDAIERLSFTDANNGVGLTVAAPTEPPQRLQQTTDGGKTWRPIELKAPSPYTIADLAPFIAAQLPNITTPNEGSLLAQIESNLFVYHSIDSGKTWEIIPAGSLPDESRLYIGPKGELWSLRRTETLEVAISSDHGETWSKSPLDAKLRLEGLIDFAVRSATSAIAVTEQSILQTIDGGKTWTALPK